MNTEFELLAEEIESYARGLGVDEHDGAPRWVLVQQTADRDVVLVLVDRATDQRHTLLTYLEVLESTETWRSRYELARARAALVLDRFAEPEPPSAPVGFWRCDYCDSLGAYRQTRCDTCGAPRRLGRHRHG